MSFQLTIPMAIQLTIEDVGWWEKSHPVGPDDPFRTGMKRRHDPLDYEALVLLARELGMRPLIGFVACEWDRENILRKIPSATWMGSDWDNSRNVGPWQEEAAAILHSNRSHLEIGLHAVGHEYWEAGRRSRTEFHTPAGDMRPAEDIRQHLEAFGEILAQNGLDPFPTVFIPPGLNHAFGNGPEGIHAILNRFGLRHVITDLNKARKHRPLQHSQMAWEKDVLLMERGAAPMSWDIVTARPQFAFDRPILCLHWANLLHENMHRNVEVIRDWVAFIRNGYDRMEQMLAPDMATCISQFAYRTFSRIHRSDESITIDLRDLQKLPARSVLPAITIHIQCQQAVTWRIEGGRMVNSQLIDNNLRSLTIHIHQGSNTLRLIPLEN